MIALYIFVLCVHMCSVGRDKIINVWDIKEGKSKKTIPVFEVQNSVIYVLCIGDMLFVVFRGCGAYSK